MNENSSKVLFLFTNMFPYRGGEPFLSHELPFLARHFKKTILVNEHHGNPVSELPPNVELFTLGKSRNRGRFRLLLAHFFRISWILLDELKHCPDKIFFFRNIRRFISMLLSSFADSEQVTQHKLFGPQARFYSYWMNRHALTLSILKMEGKIGSFLFRVHGFDLYRERWPSNYIPFHHTCHSQAKHIVTVSEKGADYFRKSFGFGDKVSCSYLGSSEKGMAPVPEGNDILHLVSCSNIIQLKRIHLIIQTLSELGVNARWTHFGDGELRSQLEKEARQLPSTIQIHFMGQVSQNELFNFYLKVPVHFFINVSESEGLPFTLIEAASFGIPLIATNVGGCSEIVDRNTGILLDPEFKPSELAAILREHGQLGFNTSDKRTLIKRFWKGKFAADNTYPGFINRFLN